MERKSPIADVLLGKTKQNLLSAILLQPERSWYLSEVARYLQVPPSSLQRELAQFVESGIVVKRQDGNRVYFQADRTCPVFEELFGLLTKTVGLADLVRDALTPFQDRIELAFIYGSVATSRERSSSDVDLMLVGEATLAEVAFPVRELESRLGRVVNLTVYTSLEFAKRVAEKNHLLTAVLETELLFILGTANDLARLVKRPKGSRP
ncbi:MAG: ArsR family transcriptional regulator [Acidobacteria bacterium]|nr:ArsR family transcriptional regulator [Acidobacteriota bacterium]